MVSDIAVSLQLHNVINKRISLSGTIVFGPHGLHPFSDVHFFIFPFVFYLDYNTIIIMKNEDIIMKRQYPHPM